MTGRTVTLTIVGFLVGALAAGGIGVRVIREVKTAQDATSLPPANVAGDAYAPFPIEIPFTVSETAPDADLGFGVTVELVDVLPTADAVTVRLAVTVEDPERADLLIVGTGPGWRSMSDTVDGIVTLTWAGERIPDVVPLAAVGTVGFPIGGGS